MLFKFPKYTQLNYSTILFILILSIKFANLTLTNYDDETYYYDAKIDDEQFVNLCKETSKDLESKIAETPANILNNRDRRPYNTVNNDFDDYIAEKIEFLADEMNKIKQKFMDEEPLFDGAIEKFNNIFEKAKKESIWNQEKVLEIFDENPHQFFATLDQLLWKIENKNLEKIEEENGKILIKYTKNIGVINYYKRIVLMVPIEYIILRKTINKFINRLKIEILYIRDIGTIESKIAEIPVTIQNNGDLRPYFPRKKDFDDYIYEKIEFLADEINQLRQNTKHKETLFDHAINKLVKTIEEAKKDAIEEAKNDADGNEEDEKIQDGIHGLILDKILDKNPHQFFATLNELLWKINDVNLQKVEQKNGEILMKYTEDEGGPKPNHHSKGNLLMVSNKYIILRKMINKFIKELIIQILYVQSLVAIEYKIAEKPTTILNYRDSRSFFKIEKDFDDYIGEKIVLLAKSLNKIKLNTKDKESLFDHAIKKYDNIFEKAKEDSVWYYNIVLEILDENPNEFFTTLDQLLWKKGEILMKYIENEANHSTENALIFPKEYMILRKRINKYINKLKIEIRYVRSTGAII